MDQEELIAIVTKSRIIKIYIVKRPLFLFGLGFSSIVSVGVIKTVYADNIYCPATN